MGTLNDNQKAFFGADWKEALVNGSMLMNHYDPAAVAAGASVYLGFTTGPDPVLLQSRNLISDAANTWIELFEGGTYTGGTPTDNHVMNRILDTTAGLLADIKGGVTISVAGVSVWHVRVVGAKNTIVGDSADSPSMILKPNTVYYYQFRNDDGGAHDYFTRFVHSRYLG